MDSLPPQSYKGPEGDMSVIKVCDPSVGEFFFCTRFSNFEVSSTLLTEVAIHEVSELIGVCISNRP